MHRLLAAAFTCVIAAGLAVGAGFGIVAALNATPEQPNVPLVRFHSSPDEIPGLTDGLPSPSASSGTPDAPDASDNTASPGPDGEPSGSAAPGD